MEKGLIHIYTGDGKGKTSAAIGLALRAAGRGKKVVIARFLKDSDSGEVIPLKKTRGIKVLDTPAALPFYFMMSDKQKREYAAFAAKLLEEAFAVCDNGDGCEGHGMGVIILDEVLDAAELGIINKNRLHDLLNEVRAEVVMTGRRGDDFMDLAGYATEFKCIKHPYQNGIAGREGIEY